MGLMGVSRSISISGEAGRTDGTQCSLHSGDHEGLDNVKVPSIRLSDGGGSGESSTEDGANES